MAWLNTTGCSKKHAQGEMAPWVVLGVAMSTVVYVLNRSPTKSVDGMTPSEAWHGKKCRCFTGCPPRGMPKVVSLGE
jgi:hypothetical protein